MIPPPVNPEQIHAKIAKFYADEWPDDDMIVNFMKTLGIHDIVELEFCLKNRIQRERNAAMKMIENHLDDLISGNPDLWKEAKDTLKQLYYKVEQVDEEAFL